MNPIVIFGAAGHAKVVVEAIEQLGNRRIAGLIADRTLGLPYPVLGGDADVTRLWKQLGPFDAHIAVADAAIRRRIADRVARELPSIVFPPIVHPMARVARNAVVSPGAFVAIGATLGADARVGGHAIVNTNASIDHDCDLGDFSFVGPGAALGGTVVVGPGAWVGLGASILANLRIGANATVGAGAVVVRDVAEGSTVIGVPARPRN
jgi:sugar O-acyltransferase (sialic acid O-acetyltransferase NeuD family)